MYTLNVKYSAKLFVESDNSDFIIEEAVGKMADSTGIGFGFRDMQFENLSQKELLKAKENLQALKGKIDKLVFFEE